MATRRIRAHLRAAVVGSVAVTALVVVPVLAAVPGEASPQLTIAQVQARVDDLNNQAEIAAEARNAVDDQVAQTDALSAKVRARIATQTAALAKVRAALGVFASAAYQSDGIDSTMQLMLSDNPSNFLDQSSSLEVVARGQQAALRRVADATQQLAESKIELAQTLAQQQKLAAAAEVQTRAIQAKAAEATALLNSLQAGQRRALLAQEHARELAAQRASQAALIRTADIFTHRSGATGTYDGPASGPAAEAVAYARAQVGKGYVWGAAGPNVFDCSGLTMAAWAHAGVSLPHYTVAQYDATRHVSLADVEPGDLLFFHADMHHVGIYIGGGEFVQAEDSANGVVVSPVAGWWGAQVSGVGRP